MQDTPKWTAKCNLSINVLEAFLESGRGIRVFLSSVDTPWTLAYPSLMETRYSRNKEWMLKLKLPSCFSLALYLQLAFLNVKHEGVANASCEEGQWHHPSNLNGTQFAPSRWTILLPSGSSLGLSERLQCFHQSSNCGGYHFENLNCIQFTVLWFGIRFRPLLGPVTNSSTR